MNTIRHLAITLAITAIAATQTLTAAVVNITQGSTSGYTMTDGNTYVVQNSVSFSNSTAGGSGMTVADNATVVLYIPTNVTLTARGGNGSGRTGGGAGIRVPATATLIITGEGTVNATGGNAGNGGNGSNGANGGSISCRTGNYPFSMESTQNAYGAAGKGKSGEGGVGGIGGGGAGAGIGGNGGLGGAGGSSGVSRNVSSYVLLSGFCGNGNAGMAGGDGTSSAGMGCLYIIGSPIIFPSIGYAGARGTAGSKADWTYYFYDSYSDYHFATCGGGGGGGGGAGSAPSCAIGGGGASGGGGGGGGSGATAARDDKYYDNYPLSNANGGGGSGGQSIASTGQTGTTRGETRGGQYSSTSGVSKYYGGNGGAGGSAGTEGGAGTLYVSPTATVNVNRTKLSASTHSAAQYTITFDTNGGQFASATETLIATLGCDLPACIPTPTKRGYIFEGWETEEGVEYYDASGLIILSSYPIVGNVTLYAQWMLDTDRTVIPDNPFWLRDNVEVGWLVEPEAGENIILRSGAIGNNTNSWMEASIVGPASFSFDWKVSCNTRGHYLAWFIDDVEQARIRGVTDWATVTASIPEGEHAVRFDYVKGSTAASGEDKGQVRNFTIDPVRVQTASMQVMWDWTTNYLVSVTTTGFGTADFESGWIATRSNLVVNIEPSIHSYRIALSGDTNGVVLAGMQLDIPVRGAARDISVSIEEIRPHLVVISPQGMSDPVVGEHEYPSDAEVTVSAIAPNPENGVRAVCTGWTGTGSVPAAGDGDLVSFCITNDSSITWNWETGYHVDFTIVGKGSSSFASQWVAEGTNLAIPFTVNTPFYSLALSGDADGAVIGDGTVTFTVNAPRSIVLSVTEYTYKESLDENRLFWSSGGAAVWEAQTAISHDGEDAVKSGPVTGDDVSLLSTTVIGPGTLSWWWRLDMTDCAGVEVFVDDASVANLDAVEGWSQESVEVTGPGTHQVRFEFWNAGTENAISDCAYLDQVSWSGEVQLATSTTPTPVPYTWLRTYYPGIADELAPYELKAKAIAANGVNKVWECYVAGLVPTNVAEVFRTVILSSSGAPVISWEPRLSAVEEAKRTYTVEGKEKLTDDDWAPTNSASRFFRVKVTMP